MPRLLNSTTTNRENAGAAAEPGFDDFCYGGERGGGRGSQSTKSTLIMILAIAGMILVASDNRIIDRNNTTVSIGPTLQGAVRKYTKNSNKTTTITTSPVGGKNKLLRGISSSNHNGSPDGSSLESSSSLDGLSLLIAICAFDLGHQMHLWTMIDSFRDLCETGLREIHIHIYTTVEWPKGIRTNLERRASDCTGSSSGTTNMTLSFGIEDASWGTRLSSLHRRLFYENLQRYDLFLYSEDDHLIRPSHVTGFVRETHKVERLVGKSRASDYAIGFLRYEQDDKQRYIWEHKFNETHFLEHNGIYDEGLVRVVNNNTTTAASAAATTSTIGGSRRRPLYFNGKNLYHQGFYLATRFQLEQWKIRVNTNGYECKFDDIRQVHHRWLPREYASSLQLFRYCNVTQLIPLDHWQDFLVNHMPNNYVGGRKFLALPVEDVDQWIHAGHDGVDSNDTTVGSSLIT